MKKIIFVLAVLVSAADAKAQFTKATLQASGLTCSMCSKAVKNALEKVPFVQKVQVDIKNQQYNLLFKPDAAVEFDALKKAVEDAGFSVANLRVTANLNNVTVQKDEHVKIGNRYFHFLNATGQQLNGTATFSIVDKTFVTDKEHKKWSAATKMKCVQTGRAEACCVNDGLDEHTRIYHVII